MRLRLLPKTTITDALTGWTSTPITGLANVGDLTAYANFDYGSGGTTVKAWVQTTLDGVNWIDIMSFAFTTADSKKALSVSVAGDLTTNPTLADGALADNTVLTGLIGDQLRVKITSTGTYAGATTLTIDIEAREDAGSASTAGLDSTSLAALETIQVGSIAAGETHIGEVGGNVVVTSATFTRPADTTAYAANDAVNNSTSAPTAMTFANAARVSGGSGYITKVVLYNDLKTITNGSFRLYLFSVSPTMVNDNAAYALLYSERANLIGYSDLTVATEDGTNSTGAMAVDASIRLPFVAAATSIFGLLVAKAAYTPANGENFTVYLTIDRN